MLDALNAEYRKLMSIRSTYVIVGLGLLLAGALAFWGIGYKGGNEFATDGLAQTALTAISVMGTFVGIIAILIITHEYRYNTIYYTLASSNNRLKVLAAKMIIMGAFTVLLTLFSILFAMAAVIWGLKLGHHSMPPQDIQWYTILWKSISFMLGNAWLGLLIGFLVRSQVAAIVTFFMLPLVEQLLRSLLKVSSNYLPNATLNQIIQTGSVIDPKIYTPAASLRVFSLYLAGALLVSAVLFVRRDAN